MNPLYFFLRKSVLFFIFISLLSFTSASQNCAGVDFTYKIIDNTVVFTAESKLEISEWAWSFGDNTGANGQIVKHIYEKNGEYEVCLKFYSSKDCSGVICKKVKYESDVNDCGLSADFTFKTDGNTVIFNAVSNDSLSKYLWSVTGQNKQYHGKDIKIAFEKNGTYEVCLIVVNSEETCKIQICKKVEIGTTCDVDIDFKYETSDNFIKLLARSSAEGNEKYFWSFGNGDTAAGKKVGYKYDKPGVYEICLKVVIEDPKDPNVVCTKTICKKVTINALNTECNIKADFRVKTDGLTAILSGISSELDATYTWYVNGLKDQYSGKDVKILFPKEGVYEVCLIVVNRAQTCKVQVCNKVEIKILSED